jgi:hypothetical protein
MRDSEDLLELQTRLREDPSGKELRRLQDMLAQTRRRIDSGVAPAEFRNVTRLIDALDAAGEVLAAAWRRYHPGNAV